MAFKIAIANHKGGVAKSTTTLMVAEALACFGGLRVLVIDMDPQCSITTMLLSDAGARAAGAQFRTLSQLLSSIADGGSLPLSRVITSRASDLVELRDAIDQRRVDLIASNSALLTDINVLETKLRRRFGEKLDVAIASALAPEIVRIDRSYDAIVFDCAAGTGPLSLAAIRLSNFIIAPSVLDAVSMKALRDFIEIILKQSIDAAGHVSLKILPTIYRTGDPVQRQTLDAFRSGAFAVNAFERAIPDSVSIRRAVERIRPDSYRNAREKYATLIGDVQWLCGAVQNFVNERGAKA